jgi:hypothetical protein
VHLGTGRAAPLEPGRDDTSVSSLG